MAEAETTNWLTYYNCSEKILPFSFKAVFYSLFSFKVVFYSSEVFLIYNTCSHFKSDLGICLIYRAFFTKRSVRKHLSYTPILLQGRHSEPFQYYTFPKVNLEDFTKSHINIVTRNSCFLLNMSLSWLTLNNTTKFLTFCIFATLTRFGDRVYLLHTLIMLSF